MKKLTFLFAFILLLNGCSKDDNSSAEQETENIIDGGDVFTSQLVTIQSDNINSDEYNATLGDWTLKALKSGNNEIMFLVPINYSEGEILFEVADLNLKIKYNVKNTVLSQSAEATISPFVSNIMTFKDEIENEPESFAKQNVLSSLNLFEHELETASDEDKRQLAEFYFMNKNLIDSMYQTDYTTPLARNYDNLDADDVFNNFKVSVVKALAISGLSYMAFSIPSPDLFSKLLAAGTAIIAVKCWFDSYDLFNECKTRNIFTKDFLVGNIASSLSGNQNNDIIIYSHSLIKEDLVIKRASTIDNSYLGSSISAISTFFENLNVLSNIIWKINYVIDKVNQFNPFSDIESIPNAELDDTSSTSDINVSDEMLNTITYTVDDSNINIDEIQFQNGVMKTKLSIVDQDIVSGDFVETNLNFQYQDGFSDIEGSYPIRINKEEEDIDLTGCWAIENTNTTSGTCGWTFLYFTLNADNSVTIVGETCNENAILNDNATSASYILTGDSFTLNFSYDTGDVAESLSFNGTYSDIAAEEIIGTYSITSTQYGTPDVTINCSGDFEMNRN